MPSAAPPPKSPSQARRVAGDGRKKDNERHLLAQIKELQRQLDQERAEQAKPSQAGNEQRTRVIVVANRLPITVRRAKEGSGWSLERSSGGLVSAFLGVRNMDITWVGWPGMAVPAEEQEAVRAELRKTEHMPFECVPVFLDETTAELSDAFASFHLVPQVGRERVGAVEGAGERAGEGGDGVGVEAGVHGSSDRFGRVVAVGQEEPECCGQGLQHVGAVVDVRHRFSPGGIEEATDLTDAVGETHLAKVPVGAALNPTDIGEVGAERVGEFIEEGGRVEGRDVGPGESGDGVGVHHASGDGKAIGVGDDRVAGRSGTQCLEIGHVTQAHSGGSNDGAIPRRGHPGAVPRPAVAQTDHGLTGGVGHVPTGADATDHASSEGSGMGLVCFEKRFCGLEHELGVAAIAPDAEITGRGGQSELTDLTVMGTDLLRGEPLDGAAERVADGSTEHGATSTVVGGGAGFGKGSGGGVASGAGGNEASGGEFRFDIGLVLGGFGGVGHVRSWAWLPSFLSY